MTTPSELELMRYADGEAAPDEVARVEAYLAAVPGARERVAGIHQLGDFLRAHVETSGNHVDVADAVMERLGRDPPAPSQRGMVRRLRPRAWAAPFIGATALAAAAAVLLLLRPAHSPSEGPVASGPSVQAPAAEGAHSPSAVAVRGPARSTGAEIEAIEFGGGGGSIFLVDREGEATPVVWLADDGEPGTRMEPL